MKPVLVLDANQRSALTVTRSLGRHGVPVYTADESRSALAGSSCYSKLYNRYPSPRHHATQFILAIAELCEKENITIIFPVTELTTQLVLENCDQLPGITLPFADIDIINKLADKHALMLLAETLDIPIPHTLYVNKPDRLSFDLNSLIYPLVLKPGRSWLQHDSEWLHTSVRFAEKAADADDILQHDLAFHAHPFLLQDCVPGKGAGVFALYNRGEAITFFAHKRLREKPPRGGVSVLSESVVLDPVLLSYTRTLLDHVGWHGIAMVEFRVEDNGKPWLMEVNTRFWGSLQLAVDSGVDFPWLLYQVACGENIQPVENYKSGKRLRWLLGDLDSLYLVLRDSHFSLAEKFSALLAFIWPAPFRTKHEVNRLSDMGPCWWEIKKYLKDLKK